LASQWPPWDVTSLRSGLDDLAALLELPKRKDLTQEALDWLGRLLVVRSCGYLEQTVVETCRGYIEGKSGGPARSFAHSWIERGPNPSPDALTALTGRFDAGWAADLESFLDADDQRLRREIAFLVDRRNRIAHGLNEGVGPTKALTLKDIACETADWFVLRLNPGR
jgi:hypothetical protein